MNRAVIGIGSNLEPDRNVPHAVGRIATEYNILARSRIIETFPVGPPDQPNYLNTAILIETEQDLNALKTSMHGIEDQMGRIRSSESKYAPRNIDLDVVVWNGEVVHEDYYEREFLRELVGEIWPEIGA